MKKNRKRKLVKLESLAVVIRTIILFTVGIIMVLPMLWMISASFKPERDVFTMPINWIPKNPIITNYIHALTDYPYLKWYYNTVVSTLCIVIVILIISSLAGYAFAKLPFKGRDILFFLFITTMMVPVQVKVIPQYMMFKAMHINNTMLSIIVGWTYNAFAIFMMRQFFTSIPDELIEASRIDGASELRTFIQVVIPLAKAQLSALGILAFTWGWNQYFGPLIYISDTKKQVLSVGIATFKSTYTQNYATQMAGATLAVIPIIIVYIFAQKYFVEGIALSGVKG